MNELVQVMVWRQDGYHQIVGAEKTGPEVCELLGAGLVVAAAWGRSCNIDNNTGPEGDDQPCFQITKIAHVDHGELGSWDREIESLS